MTRDERNKYNYGLTHKIIDGVEYKQCSKCKGWYPCNQEYFYRNKNNKSDGLIPECKICSIARSTKSIDNRREEYLAYLKQYYQDNHEQQIEGFHQYRLDTLEEHQAYFKNYQKENRELVNAHSKKKQKELHIISKPEWLNCKHYFGDACAYCGITEEEHRKKYKQDLHKDHGQFDGLRDLSNCLPACKSCNSKKWQSSIEEWYNESNPIYDKNKSDRISKWLDQDYKEYIVNIDTEHPTPKQRAEGQTREGKVYNIKDPSKKASRKKRVVFKAHQM